MIRVHVIGLFQFSSRTAAAAAARTLDGSEPMVRCSRLDLFQTGMTSTPCSAAFRHARRSEERRVGKSVDLGGRRIIKKKKKRKTMSEEHIEGENTVGDAG